MFMSTLHLDQDSPITSTPDVATTGKWWGVSKFQVTLQVHKGERYVPNINRHIERQAWFWKLA